MSLRSIRQGLREDPAQPSETEPRYEEAIEAARQTGDREAEAAAWDLLGEEKEAEGNLDQAESALGEALQLRAWFSRGNLGFSYAKLGDLRLKQAQRAAPDQRMRLAMEAYDWNERALGAGPVRPATFELLHQRGRIREVLGKPELALADFGAAVKDAGRVKRSVPAALSLVTGANVALQHEVFDSFVEAAGHEALRTGNRKLAEEAFLALEANRAASLRESRELAAVWKAKLPQAYWETLGRLDREESRELSTDGTVSPESKRLHLELTEMESTAGVGVSVMSTENFQTRNSLIHVQEGLRQSDLLLSFYLGERESYLWAVTRNSLELHKLPPESEVREDVRRFRDMIAPEEPSKTGPGRGQPQKKRFSPKDSQQIYQRLFGSLKPSEAAKSSWLLSLDGPLFGLPFAALVTDYENGRPVYAAERHSSQLIPGAWAIPKESPGAAHGNASGFLGVADAIYNSADPRSKSKQGWNWWPRLFTKRRPESEQLNRLVNSDRELRRASQSWQGERATESRLTLLEGTAARRGAFLAALNAKPSAIHLATHVVAPTNQSKQAFLVFSLESSGGAGLLSTAEIGLLNVPGALVVMTGCATGTGDARAGAGLLGLTRAWMMAGAKAVVGTNWPVPDADSDLIPDFYRHVPGASAAEALRRAQANAIHSGSWQASPSFWAAFQVTGGAQ